MLKQIKNFLLAATVIVAASCKPSFMTSSHSTKGTDFSAYKTYGFGKIDTNNISQQNVDYIIQSVKTKLSAKQYTENKASPDMLVSISTAVKSKQTKVSKTGLSGSSDIRTSIYWSQYKDDPSLQTTVTNPKIKIGSLVITLTDAKTKKQLWQGAMSAELTKSPKNPEQAISTAVNKIMAGLPSGI